MFEYFVGGMMNLLGILYHEWAKIYEMEFMNIMWLWFNIHLGFAPFEN